ncbi:anthranilate phosphoribosyltransferase [Acidipropionibacterium virtanenii]|uniref:Anthranilate phosphoribosyltransferase n=1 Tax=Acidipropionibacterium virtanenii TaxID=2057246 RepID=A0A344UVE2_9ACTN|nr:anthranilate phosphoribosyltransferase [Acidipropionibacterium virtanenii]AXE39240.1 Anthranilate phosphoribosyltransferase [Acidipropionibacterium virtanenii]
MAETFPRTWPDLLTDLVNGCDLDRRSSVWAMDRVLSGDLTAVQVAGFAVALRAKGETVEELSGLAEGMLGRATKLELDRETVDIVGTGGDRANTVNVSTMAAIVASAAGAKVVKHGNRAASSACGTADCLEALGVNLNLAPADQAGVLDAAHIVFLFAPLYHASLRFAGPARKELGIQTTFNLLGPLTNPARPHADAIGIADARMAPLVAGVLTDRGSRGLVFHGGDGLDELTTTTDSQIWLFREGRCVRARLDPADLGLPRAQPKDLVGGGPEHNAQVVRDLLDGATGPVRDIVLLNAAAALLAYDGPDLDAPLTDQFAERIDRAATAVDSGQAREQLARWIEITST